MPSTRDPQIKLTRVKRLQPPIGAGDGEDLSIRREGSADASDRHFDGVFLADGRNSKPPQKKQCRRIVFRRFFFQLRREILAFARVWQSTKERERECEGFADLISLSLACALWNSKQRERERERTSQCFPRESRRKIVTRKKKNCFRFLAVTLSLRRFFVESKECRS